MTCRRMYTQHRPSFEIPESQDTSYAPSKSPSGFSASMEPEEEADETLKEDHDEEDEVTQSPMKESSSSPSRNLGVNVNAGRKLVRRADLIEPTETSPEPVSKPLKVKRPKVPRPKVDQAELDKLFDKDAELSEDEHQFGGMRDDADDEDFSGSDRELTGFVAHEKEDATVEAEQDELARGRHQQHLEEDDAKLTKMVNRDTTGDWRKKRRADDMLGDSDYSDDEFGVSKKRGLQDRKRHLAGGDDEMERISKHLIIF